MIFYTQQAILLLLALFFCSIFAHSNLGYEEPSKTQCQKDVEEFEIQLEKRNPMAIKMNDAFGTFPSDGVLDGNWKKLGSYSSCLEVNFTFLLESKHDFRGQYCLITTTPSYLYNGSESTSSQKIGEWRKGSGDIIRSIFLYKRGICVPDSCSNEEIKKMLHETSNPSYTKFLMECHRNERDEFTSADIAMILILSLFGILVFASSICEAFFNYFYMNRKMGKAFQMLLVFSLVSNTKNLLSTKVKGKGHIHCLDGIRLFSFAWVMISHVGLNLGFQLPLTNTKHVTEVYDNFQLRAIMNGYPSVDTFFLMSGLLVAYLMFKELDRGKGNLLFLPMAYVHRYLRISAPYAIVIGFHATLLRFLSYGPLNQVEPYFVTECQEVWWQNLLYINNFGTQLCMDHAWYLAVDMQMFWVSPLMFVPMWYLWKKKGAVWSIAYGSIWLLAATLVVLIMTIVRDWSGSAGDADWTYYNYIKPWCRFQPYGVGIILGVILHKTKNKPVVLHKAVVAAGWITAFAIGLSVIYGWDPDPNDIKTKAENALYGGFNRLAWGLALGWLIFACCRGYGGWINQMLSWEAFIPIGRLTFAMYLVHYPITSLVPWSFTSTTHINYLIYAVISLAVFAYTLGVGIITALFVEIPLSLTEKHLFSLGTKRQKSS